MQIHIVDTFKGLENNKIFNHCQDFFYIDFILHLHCELYNKFISLSKNISTPMMPFGPLLAPGGI